MVKGKARCEENDAERAPRRRSRHGRNVESQVFRPSVRGCARFLPWLIKSGWGLGQLTAHLVLPSPRTNTHTHVCTVCQHSCIDWHGLTPFNCPWAEAVAKAESIKSVSHSGTIYPTCLQAASILSILYIYIIPSFTNVCRQKRACLDVCVCVHETARREIHQ